VVCRYLPELPVRAQPHVLECLIETGNRPPIHLLVHAIAAMYADDRCFIAVLLGIGGGPSKRLAPVGRQPLAMLRMKPVTERVAHHLVGHHLRMPRVGEAQQTLLASDGLELALHIVLTPGPCS